MKIKLSVLTVCTVALIASAGCMGKAAYNLPPSQRLMEPGPGVGGPGPGVLQPMGNPRGPMGAMGPGGGVQAAQAMGMGYPPGCGPGAAAAAPPTSQIAFLGVEGGEVAWDVSGQGLFDSAPLVMPGRQNFHQGALYRLKLTNIPDRPGVELYPTMEVAPVTPRTDSFLAHAPVPIQFTDEDLDQVLSGNFVTKVIYLPDPEFQELALAGVATLVSTRLDPGVDPIAEADRRGSILAILRVGNLDLQTPNQLAMGDSVVPANFIEEGEDGFGEGKVIQQVSGPQGGNIQQSNYGYGYGAPRGMPTANFAPQIAPPNLISGVNSPQWGMPMSGTPIGLPGPPHIPLGSPAGLTKHTIRNRTRMRMPPPVHNMKITVKQRPGMNYPRPVNHVNISEANRAGFRMFGGTVPPAGRTAVQKMGARMRGGFRN